MELKKMKKSRVRIKRVKRRGIKGLNWLRTT
jgi:hypothetical protein